MKPEAPLLFTPCAQTSQPGAPLIFSFSDPPKAVRIAASRDAYSPPAPCETPALLERMSMLINDPVNPPTNEVRAAMLQGLEAVRSAMEKLERVKVE